MQPIAVETLGPINESASDFFSLLTKKISHHSGDERETAFMFQRVSVLVQRFNGVLLHDSLNLCLRTARSNGHSGNFLPFFPNPSGSSIPRVKNNNNIILYKVFVVKS